MADPSSSLRSAADRFGRLDWADDDASFELGGQRYVVEDATAEDDRTAFRFYKPRSMVDQYERFFATVADVPRTIVELGIWDGGSVAFWTELLGPTRYLAVDKDDRGSSELFERHVSTHGLHDVVDCRWGVDQADHAALWSLLDEHQLAEVDLVIDDASHTYGPTLATFAGLFPRVRPGGHYVIEDWAWPFREPYRRKDHPWATRADLLPLLQDLLAALGTDGGAIGQIQVFADFVAVERGPLPLAAPLELGSLISPRERPHAKLAIDATRRYTRKAISVVRQTARRVPGG